MVSNSWSFCGGGRRNRPCVRYTAPPLFTGTVVFTYQVCDFGGNCSTATVTVTVTLDRFSPVTVDVPPARPEVRIVLQPAPIAEDVLVLGTVERVRAATKTDTLVRDVPQAITVVSENTMAELNMTSMADVVRYVPGVGYAQGEGNRDTLVFRGNSSTSDFYVDGVRDDAQYYRDVYNLARVETLKGPNAMIFGRGGVGGLINRVQRVADWSPARELSLRLAGLAHAALDRVPDYLDTLPTSEHRYRLFCLLPALWARSSLDLALSRPDFHTRAHRPRLTRPSILWQAARGVAAHASHGATRSVLGRRTNGFA